LGELREARRHLWRLGCECGCRFFALVMTTGTKSRGIWPAAAGTVSCHL
jgi:hypothetical protein